jgi:hypothetical protein
MKRRRYRQWRQLRLRRRRSLRKAQAGRTPIPGALNLS